MNPEETISRIPAFIREAVQCIAVSFPVAKDAIYAGGISAGGSITNAEITARTPWPEQQPVLSNADLVARLLELMHLQLPTSTVDQIVAYADGATVWERNGALLLLLLAPEMHLA